MWQNTLYDISNWLFKRTISLSNSEAFNRSLFTEFFPEIRRRDSALAGAHSGVCTHLHFSHRQRSNHAEPVPNFQSTEVYLK